MDYNTFNLIGWIVALALFAVLAFLWLREHLVDGQLDRSRTRFLPGPLQRGLDETARELLRMKFRASGCRDGYAYNVGDAGVVKVAPAREYHFAMLAGMEDFWQYVPALEGGVEVVLSAAKLEEDLAHCERDFALVLDGNSKTYVDARRGITVPNRYDCAWPPAEEVRQVIDDAKRKAHGGKGESKPVEHRVFHEQIIPHGEDPAQ